MNKYKVATGVFLGLALFNLLFPPLVRYDYDLLSKGKEIKYVIYLNFIFNTRAGYDIYVNGLIILFFIALVISVLAQFAFDIIQEIKMNKKI